MTLHALRRWWPLVAVAALLAAASLSAAHATPRLDRISGPNASAEEPPRLDPAEDPPSGGAPPQEPVSGIDLPGWLPMALGAVLLLLAAAVVVILVRSLVGRLLRRDGPDGDGPEVAASPVRAADADILAAVNAGLTELSDSDADPRRAVIACWLRLEEAASAAGVPRRDTDTATDLVVRLLSGAIAAEEPAPGGEPYRLLSGAIAAEEPAPGREPYRLSGGVGGGAAGAAEPAPGREPYSGGRVASAEVLARFADIYREARYASHPIDDGMREQARAALYRLRAELTSPVPR